MNKNILLLHGWGSNTQKLNSLKEELTNLGWRVYLPTLPGFDAPDPTEIWNNDNYVNYVLKATRKFFKNKSFFVFGHSFGGGLAIKIALLNDKNIEGIVLCSAARVARKVNIFTKLFFNSIAKAGKVFLPVPFLGLFLRKVLYKAAGAHGFDKKSLVMQQTFKKVVSENLRSQVKIIKLPTLVLWGEKDKMTPIENAYFLNESIKNSTLIIFEDDGHKLPYDRPKEVAGEIQKWFSTLN
ncbi:MAG: alpha/beta hydrolase [Patescibacteria group bacterium]